MKINRYFFFAAIFAVLSGCATTAGTTGGQLLSAESADDGIINQKTEFRDLPAELQQSIVEGG